MRRIVLVAAALFAASPLGASRDEGVAYTLTLAGLPIGDAALRAERAGEGYRLEGRARLRFLFWGGEGVATAEGAAAGGALEPRLHRMAYEGVTRPGSLAIDFENGRAVRWESAPPPPPEVLEGRVPLTEAHREGVVDPLTALVIAAPADVAPDALCRRVAPVFSGMTRFDLVFEGAAATAEGVVDCAVRYRPVAGHRPESRGVERLSAPGAIQVSLAPLADGLWGPERVAIATRFGTAELTRVR
jgi:hypothetical protein